MKCICFYGDSKGVKEVASHRKEARRWKEMREDGRENRTSAGCVSRTRLNGRWFWLEIGSSEIWRVPDQGESSACYIMWYGKL